MRWKAILNENTLPYFLDASLRASCAYFPSISFKNKILPMKGRDSGPGGSPFRFEMIKYDSTKTNINTIHDPIVKTGYIF